MQKDSDVLLIENTFDRLDEFWRWLARGKEYIARGQHSTGFLKLALRFDGSFGNRFQRFQSNAFAWSCEFESRFTVLK
jgi:hypothetical protein